MDSLRIVLVIIGLLIILGLLGHGLWTIRKNNQVAKDKRESLERKRRRPPEDLFSAAEETDFEPDATDPLDAKLQASPKRSRRAVHVEQASVTDSGRSNQRSLKQEPELHEAVDESLLQDERTHADIEQMEINLDDDEFALREQARHDVQEASADELQPGLLDDEEPRILSADESGIEALDDIEKGLRADGNVGMQAAPQHAGFDESEFDEPEVDDIAARDSAQPEQEKAAAEPTKQEPEIEVVTLFVTGDIQGAILLQMTTELGLKYGEMDIFHRHLESSGHGPVLFSVANMFNPGTFDIHNMERFETQGIVLFMTLPLKSDGHQAFTMMYNAANKIADAMPRAAVLDGNRNPMTKQSVQHTYQRIREFERKQRLQKTTPQW